MRVLDDWLTTFKEWTLPRSEAPETFITWAGLFTLSSVLKRKVAFPKSLLGSYEIVPNLYVVFIGPPGVVRKSTTTAYAENMLTSIEGVTMSSTAMSKSKLIEKLTEIDDASISILSSEFSNFINVSKEEMYDLLTDLFDGKARYEYSTRLHGDEVADRPCVNLLAATIPDWIDAQAPEHITGGGFSSRVIFIYENERRQHQMYYDEIVDHAEIERLEAVLKNDLAHIARNVEGEFRHESPAVKRAMEEWYQETARKVDKGDERVTGYYNRKHVHAHKVAMLLSISRSDELILTMDDFHNAVLLLEQIEAKMPEALSNVGRNPIAKYMKEIELYVKAQGGKRINMARILARFHHNLRPDEVKEILSTLSMIGKIKRHAEADKVEYSA